MKQKLIIIGSVAVALAIGCYFLYQWFYQPVSAEISPELSNQSKARIEQLKADGTIANTLRTPKNEEGEVFSTSCFKTIIPLPFGYVRDTEEAGKCLVRAQLVDPRGVFVVHTEYKPALSSLEETSGVNMRRQSGDYKQIDLTTNKPGTLAFQSATELTIFIYQSPQLISISFSELGEIDEEVIQAAQNAVNSIEVFSIEPTE